MVVPFERETVHPHSRGEHNRNHPLRVQPNGSSPLARGAFIISRFRRYVVRFIPTRAGSISHLESPDTSISVHPHSRGEHHHVGCDRRVLDGSSPLARGACSDRRACYRRRRFIPTRAGSMTITSPSRRRWTVHPHSRGEHISGSHTRNRQPGSSPLARGASGQALADAARGRFIPTRAGGIFIRASRSSRFSVHPHSRGEHPPNMPGRLQAVGSSPLARGAWLV